MKQIDRYYNLSTFGSVFVGVIGAAVFLAALYAIGGEMVMYAGLGLSFANFNYFDKKRDKLVRLYNSYMKQKAINKNTVYQLKKTLENDMEKKKFFQIWIYSW